MRINVWAFKNKKLFQQLGILKFRYLYYSNNIFGVIIYIEF